MHEPLARCWSMICGGRIDQRGWHAGPGDPARVGELQLPVAPGRSGHLAKRRVDGAHRAVVARPRDDRLAGGAGHGHDAAVSAYSAAFAVRGSPRRPLPQTSSVAHRPVSVPGAGVHPGGSGRHRPGAALARVRAGDGPGDC